MKKFTRILSFGLAVLLSFGLVACNPSDNGDTDNGNGEGVVVDDDVPTIVVEGFSAMRNNEARQPSTDEAFAEMQQKIIDEIGVKVEPVFMPAGAETERLNIMISSGDQLDMIMTGEWQELLQNDQIVPVNEYLDDMSNLTEMFPLEDEGTWAKITDPETGNIYGFPRSLPTTSYPVWIREDWLADLGMEQPTTVDELYDVLVAFQENDPAGNGQTIPMIVDLAGLRQGFSAGFTGQGYGYWYDEAEGVVKPPVMREGYREAVETLLSWYEEGLIHADSYTADNPTKVGWLTSNRVGSTMQWYSLVAINEPDLQGQVPEALYGYSDVIEGPEGPIQSVIPGGTSAAMILSKSEHPEAVAKFVDWLAVPENYVSSYLGIEGTDWHYSDEEQGFVVRDDLLRYGGEFYNWPFVGMIRTYTIMPSDDITEPDNYNAYLTEGSYRYDSAAEPQDMALITDQEILDSVVPNKNDFDTMLNTELVSFLTGARPMSEWDQFITEDLESAGLQEVIDAYTQMFEEQGLIE